MFIVSLSSGKDSVATYLACREAGIDCLAAFADTGWEAPETYEHLATVERVLGITVERVRAKEGGMVDIARHKAGFPHRKGRWCTDLLKVVPLGDFHDRVSAETGCDTVSVVGIRAEESTDRAAMPEFEFSEQWGGYVWRPIIDWPVSEVIAIHHRHGVPMHPHYRRGHDRVGCWPCIFATKQDIKLLAEHDPARITEIDALEREFTYERARRNVNGEGEFKHPVATFFLAKKPGELAPIREAVAWSKTTRGGAATPFDSRSA